MTINCKPFLDIEELALKLGVHSRTIRRRIQSDGLPHYRVGAVYRFDLEEVLEWLRSHEEDSSDE